MNPPETEVIISSPFFPSYFFSSMPESLKIDLNWAMFYAASFSAWQLALIFFGMLLKEKMMQTQSGVFASPRQLNSLSPSIMFSWTVINLKPKTLTVFNSSVSANFLRIICAAGH